MPKPTTVFLVASGDLRQSANEVCWLAQHAMEQALLGLDSDSHLHVSLDIDFLDPGIAPGVGSVLRSTFVAGSHSFERKIALAHW